MLIRYKAWYADGGVYEGADDEAFNLPADGFLAMMVCHPDGTRRSISGNEFIWIAHGLVGTVFGQSSGGYDRMPFTEAKADVIARYGADTHVIRGQHTDEHTIRRVMRECAAYWGYPPPLKQIMSA